ncbi:DMT family protein [Nigerium massiliense]|uniref:hypothetical protein n=1 Tax=Nigerium massiliense TaxID=1522317 RepID=UPI00090777CA|nr:hypothetical protein [Nigerium massiliense]
MPQNTPLAIALVVIGSFCFAMSAHVQHGAVGGHLEDPSQRQAMNLRSLARLLSVPRWWAGLAFMGASFLLQVAALTMAPVSVVQPVGLLAFPWSVLLAARASKTPVRGKIKVALAVTIVATLAFTVLTGVYAQSGRGLKARDIVIGALVVYVFAIAFAVMGTRGPKPWRCLFFASGGALFYGLEAALVKALIEYAQEHDWLHDPLIWGIVIALIIGSIAAGAFVQQGYATGPAEVVVGSMTVTSPVVAVLYGFLVLGEARHMGVLPIIGMIALGLCAIGGVVTLTRVHPDWQRATDDSGRTPEEPARS